VRNLGLFALPCLQNREQASDKLSATEYRSFS